MSLFSSFLNRTLISVSILLVAFATQAELNRIHETIRFAEPILSPQLNYDASKGTATFTAGINGRTVIFKLEENRKLTSEATKLATEMVIFKGKIDGQDRSWARLNYANGVVTGAYSNGLQLFLVEKAEKVAPMLSSQNYSLRTLPKNTTFSVNADDIEHDGTCALHNHGNTALSAGGYSGFVNNLSQMVQTNASKEIKITLVGDTEFVSASSDANAEMLGHLNVADGIFKEQLDIQLTLSELVPLSDNGTLTSTDANSLITAFRLKNITNPGLRHLFSGKNLNGSTVGIAYVGSLCRSSSVGVTQRYGTSTPLIFTHELGHNFGAPHDNQSGTACSSTPNGFIMNPQVNGSTRFSECSIAQMQPYIDQAAQGPFACISELAVQAPEITSSPNLAAKVGEAYLYDSDSRLDVDALDAVTFALDIAPEGMLVDENGTITWTPTADQVGVVPVQISVFNAQGQDVQFYEIQVAAADPVPEPPVQQNYINFNETSINSYGGSQDAGGTAVVGETQFQLVMEGNTWKSIDFDYTVTMNTVVEFEFSSDAQGEIQGIAFDNDNNINRNRSFSVYGTQGWGYTTYSYDPSKGTQRIAIPVGLFYQGVFDRLVFISDDDRRTASAKAVFSNVRVYEKEVEPEPEDNTPAPADAINWYDKEFLSHLSSQDKLGTVELFNNGLGVKMEGNRWKKVIFANTPITPNTVLEFEFKSTSEGEIHGIGFLPGNALDSKRSFQVHGSQNWGINDFKYTQLGEYQKFSIPVGNYFTAEQIEMVFIMDHDVSAPTGNSSFKNIVIKN